MHANSTAARSKLIRENVRAVKQHYPLVNNTQLDLLRELTRDLRVSVRYGDVLMLAGRWYITHAGLLRVAQKRRCLGIKAKLAESVSSPAENRWVFKATVLKSKSKTFIAYGDADPANVSDVVRGAEMRIAETRAVNRALRKAYGIGICSVEELGSSAEPTHLARESKKLPAQPVNGNGYGGPKLRERLCQIIHQHQLDPSLTKSYATDFCGVKSLREATRGQIETFVTHLADWAEKDRNALLCQLNSYLSQKEGAA